MFSQIPTVVSRSNVTANAMSVYSREDDGARSHSKKNSFSEIFSLAENERPLPGRYNSVRHLLKAVIHLKYISGYVKSKAL